MQKKTNNSQVATTSDIQRLERSTKSDIKRLEKSTKTDIQRLEKSTKSDFQRLRQDFKSLEKKLDGKLDKIANTLYGFVGRVDDLTIENQVGTKQARELRVEVDEHEARIKKIESTISI